MKKITFCLLLLTFYNTLALADCLEANSSANYAMLHTKKALSADNFDHQRYYAERALDAFQKTKDAMVSCGCDDAYEAITNAMINLRKAVDPEDWEKGRYYTKRALEDGNDMMNALDICTSSNGGGSSTVLNSQMSVLKNNQQNLIEEQKKIEEQKQRLLEQQQKLEKELAAQQKLQDKLQLDREKELAQQQVLKIKAEAAIKNYEVSLMEIIQVLGCNEAKQLISGNYTKTEESLRSETLTDTKRFYLERIVNIQRQALVDLEKCNVN